VRDGNANSESNPRPTICLCMIVRNEAHVIAETLECVAPHLDSWVVVDTGSTDDTIDVVRRFFRERGIPGELHESPWRDFGTNRTEALELCRGRTDYAWVIDADDLVVGELDLSRLEHDSYMLRFGRDLVYWRPQLFRTALPWRYEGRLHEYATCDEPATEARLSGDYHLESRRLGDRSRVPDTYARDAEVLLEDLGRSPHDARTAFYLAQSLLDAGDVRRALAWYGRRARMDGWDEETFYALLQKGRCHERLGEEAAAVHAHLAAWQLRPTRAEPLHDLARHYRERGAFHAAHSFAVLGMAVAYPHDDRLFVSPDVYDWRLADERSVAAFYVGRPRESFDLCTSLLDNPSVPEDDRERVLANRDWAAREVMHETLAYPGAVVDRLARRRRAARPRVTLTITSCRRLELFEQTVDSFLTCCEDVQRIGRFVCVDDGSSPADRRRMQQRYPFFEFVWKERAEKGHARSMNLLLEMLDSPYWLHLEDDWRFLVPAPYVERGLAVLRDDRRIGQVLFNRNYGETLECREIRGGLVRWTARERQRYRVHVHEQPGTSAFDAAVAALGEGARTNAWWPHFSLRPSLMRTAAIRAAGPFRPEAAHFELALAERYAAAGNRSAFFDAINCVHLGKLTWESGQPARPNAYALNDEPQFGTIPAATS
jgi:GT2 family glycosyltransferase